MEMNNNVQCFSDRRRCMPNHMIKRLSFTLKWPLIWEKKYFSSTAFTRIVPELQYENRQHQSVLPEKVPWVFCQILAIWIKIIGKNFENICQNSNKNNQFYLKRTLNWISKVCITSQCSLKVPEIFFSILLYQCILPHEFREHYCRIFDSYLISYEENTKIVCEKLRIIYHF